MSVKQEKEISKRIAEANEVEEWKKIGVYPNDILAHRHEDHPVANCPNNHKIPEASWETLGSDRVFV
jgi:hypothetical protein